MIGIELEEDGVRAPELNLWKAVLALAFSDALSNHESRISAVLKSKAHRWLMSDFLGLLYGLCFLQVYDGDYVRDHYKRLLREKKVQFSNTQLKFIRNYWINTSKKNKS
jgi:hypothetical protein